MDSDFFERSIECTAVNPSAVIIAMPIGVCSSHICLAIGSFLMEFNVMPAYKMLKTMNLMTTDMTTMASAYLSNEHWMLLWNVHQYQVQVACHLYIKTRSGWIGPLPGLCMAMRCARTSELGALSLATSQVSQHEPTACQKYARLMVQPSRL